jgi:hypothetical protein
MNIEHAARSGDEGTIKFALETLIENLKELRDRTDNGDMKALDEFFATFVFSDDKERKPRASHHDRALQGARRGEALHAIGAALELVAGTDLITACVPAINALRKSKGFEPAPWTDFAGQVIYHGDRLAHPDGHSFVAVHLWNIGDGQSWRAMYDHEPHMPSASLNLQIGDKGRAVVIQRARS